MESELRYNTPIFSKDAEFTECECCSGDGWIFGDIDDEDDNGEQRKYNCHVCDGSGQIEITD